MCYYMQCLALFLVTVVVVPAYAKDCTLHNNRGEAIKTAEAFLQRLGPLKGTKLDAQDEKYKYKIGICESVSKSDEDAAIIQMDKDGKQLAAIGRMNNTSVLGGNTWIMMTYKDGDPYRNHCSNESHRQGHLMFICDKAATTPKAKILEENNDKDFDCYYLFEVSTSVICLEEPYHISGWAIFFIIVFSLAGSYLVIGIAYKRYILGNRGMDQIPNVNTWIACGSTSADICDKLCRCNRRDEMTYASVGHSLPSNASPLDEDDQLLNT